MARTLFLFGAGASFGSGACVPYPPPLGRHLFTELEMHFSVWRDLPEIAKVAFKRDGLFEPGFEWVQKNLEERTSELMRAMAVYFLTFQPRENNLYHILIDQVASSDRRVTYATLNYDVMLDVAVMRRFGSLRYDDENTGESPLIYRPHGAAHFVPDIPIENFEHAGGRRNQAEINAPIVVKTPGVARGIWSRATSFSPCMSIYSKGKNTRTTPEVIAMAQRNFANAALAADEVFVVGTAYIPHDKHIWDPLIKTSAKLIIIDPEPEGALKVKELRGPLKTCVRKQYFDGFVASFP
jgi:hypothetical protein